MGVEDGVDTGVAEGVTTGVALGVKVGDPDGDPIGLVIGPVIGSTTAWMLLTWRKRTNANTGIINRAVIRLITIICYNKLKADLSIP